VEVVYTMENIYSTFKDVVERHTYRIHTCSVISGTNEEFKATITPQGKIEWHNNYCSNCGAVLPAFISAKAEAAYNKLYKKFFSDSGKD
jgi:hypothetical protein